MDADRLVRRGGWVMVLGALLIAGCGVEPDEEEVAVETRTSALTAASTIKHVFVIAMENHDATQIYGNTASAPYINGTLLPGYASASNFNDELALSVPSEPHYLFMEAGTNAFSDHTFSSDNDPSSSNSTSSTSHLVTQIGKATSGITWRSYQEGLNASTGSCPIHASGFYAPKHDPFVFFKDVAGSPPSATNATCVAHHRAFSALAGDLAAGDVASYTFITPNLCDDMHGASGCPDPDLVHAGDTWLAAQLPALIAYANANAGVVFVTWDEGSATLRMPFLAVGPGVKPGYVGAVAYTHASIVKSVEEILQLSTLSKVASANTLADLFQSGQYP